MIFDRLGILTDEVSPSLDEALDWAADHQLKHVEIRMIDGKNVMGMTDAEIVTIRKKVESLGLYVSALASPVFKCHLDGGRSAVQLGDTFGLSATEDVESHFRLLYRAFDIADLLNTSLIRIFSFWREEEPAKFEQLIVNHLRKAAAAADRRGKLLLLENEPSCNGGCAQEVGSLARKTESSALKVLWDPGNEAYSGRSAFPEGYEYVKDVLAHVHLKDALVLKNDKAICLPIGWGSVDFPQQLNALKKNGYTGLFTIETHFVPHAGRPLDGSELSLKGLRGMTV
jgi:sugar phosphate isomerase/epimerase